MHIICTAYTRQSFVERNNFALPNEDLNMNISEKYTKLKFSMNQLIDEYLICTAKVY